MSNGFSVPILLIIFNRLDTTKKVFAEIKKIQPHSLFIAADGPRNDRINEDTICNEVRNFVLDNIDWKYEVKTLFRDKNLGCKIAVSSALNWFFSQVEEGIILEDDCLPDQSFFPYCEELLIRFRDDEKIFMISGSNFLSKRSADKSSYYFSHLAHIWGWASWRRAWRTYDINIVDFPEFIEQKRIDKIWENKKVRDYWINCFRMVYENKLDTWDYQWVYNIFKNGGVSITPKVNLVSNIGFGSEQTHGALRKSKAQNIPTEVMNFPLKHPIFREVDRAADDYVNKEYFRSESWLKKMLNKTIIYRYVKRIYFFIKSI